MEVAIAIGLVALVAAIVTPLILARREAARMGACTNRMAAIAQAILNYHDQHGMLPAAAHWNMQKLESIALHKSKRWDLFVEQNWSSLLLPYLGHSDLATRYSTEFPVSSSQNEAFRLTSVEAMTCPSDEYNRPDNPYRYSPTAVLSIEFARGNYAINGGTNSFHTTEGSTRTPTGDHAHLEMDDELRTFRYWGNGIAGFNVSFRLDDFQNGRGTLVAINEVRAGIDPIDPRGVWALGHIASSVTWGHGVNGDAGSPNNPWVRSDDIQGGAKLNEIYGPAELVRLGMPCVSYIDESQNAASRSRHTGGVNAAFLDGAVRFVSNKIDPSLWHVMHSRETPAEVLAGDVPSRLQWPGSVQESPSPDRGHADHSTTTITSSIGIKLVLIPAGEFKMGLPDEGNDHDTPPESPAHPVAITSAYYLATTEVTQQQFLQVMEINPSWRQPPNVEPEEFSLDFPVENVTWDQAVDFCRRLSELPDEKAAGRSYRLPTEAEWEYACRAGSSVPYQYDRGGSRVAETGEAAGFPERALSKVGSYPSNPFGLHDMRGNVWEWCADWFDRDYYLRSPRKDPAGPADGYIKLVRGGDFIYVGERCFINYPPLPPWKSSRVIGFRVVCVPK